MENIETGLLLMVFGMTTVFAILLIVINLGKGLDVYKRQGTNLHISLHIDLGHLITGVLQHRLYGQQVRMSCTPRKRLHTYVEIVATRVTNLHDGSYVKAGTGMAMILSLIHISTR